MPLDLNQLRLLGLSNPDDEAQADLPNFSMPPMESSEPAPEVPAPAPKPGLPPTIASAVVGAAPQEESANPDFGIKTPSVRDYLMNKLQSGDRDLADAQEQARKNRIAVGISQAAAQGIGSMTGAAPSESLYKDLNASANAPVDQLKQADAAKSAKLKQILDQGQAQIQMAKMDPNSDMAKAYVQAAQRYAKENKINVDFTGKSPAEIEEFIAKTSPALDTILKIKSIEATRQLTAAQMGYKQDEKHQKDHDAVIADVSKQLAQTRGDAALNQAKVTEGAADKALEAIQLFKTNPKLNNEQLYNMLIAEVSKMNMGGVPGHSELENSKFTSAVTGINSLLGKVSNAPRARGETESINQLEQFIKGIKGTAQKAVGKRLNTTLWNNSPRLSKDGSDEAHFRANPDYQPYFNALKDTPESGGTSAYNPGDTRVVNGVTLHRGDDGKWRPQ